MIFTLELNRVKKTVDIPTDWDQVKFKDFIRLKDRKDLNAMSVFTGIDPETLKKVQCTNMDKFIGALAFLRTNPELFKLPTKLLGKYQIRPDLGFEPYGRYTDLQEIVEENKQDGDKMMQKYPLMCAIYCLEGEYDFNKAQQNIEEFDNAPCTEVLAAGNFLLLKLGALNSTTTKTYRILHILPKRWRLVSQLWLSRLAFTVRYYILKKKLHLTEKR